MDNVNKRLLITGHHRFDVHHLGAFPSLVSNRLLGFCAEVTIGLFFPIFLYEFFGLNLQWTLLWFAVNYIFRIPILIIGAKIFSHISLAVSMCIGSIFWVCVNLIAFCLSAFPDYNSYVFLGLLIVMIAFNYAFYWAPFHTDFAKFSSTKHRGSQIGISYALQQFIGIIGPVMGGLLIATFSYGFAFIVGIIFIFASMIPLAFLPKTNVRYEYGFLETFKVMFKNKYKNLTWSMIACGAENAIGYIIWPIFLYLIFDGRYLDIGIFASLLVVINIILQIVVGKALDSHNKQKIIRFGVHIYSLGWLFKAFVSSVFGLFLASTFHGFGAIFMNTSVDAMFYEKAADSGHYVDEFTVIREIALTIGRFSAAFILVFLTIFAPIWIAFILAAFITLGITMLTKLQVGREKGKFKLSMHHLK